MSHISSSHLSPEPSSVVASAALARTRIECHLHLSPHCCHLQLPLTLVRPRFAKEKIALAPNNPSAWNYLRGALEHTKTPFASLRTFVEPYTLALAPSSSDVVDLDNPLPSSGAELPCVSAMEFLADIYEQEGGEATTKAVEVRLNV